MTTTGTADVAEPDPDLDENEFGSPPERATLDVDESGVAGTSLAVLPAPDGAKTNVLGVPILPGGAELQDLAATACTLAYSTLVPVALRGKPNDVFLVLLTGRDLGISVTTALALLYPIEGKVTIAPKLRLALINIAGAHKGWAMWPDPGNDEEHATWYATRRDRPGLRFEYTVRIKDLEKVVDPKSGKKLLDKNNWKCWPGRMLSHRCSGFLSDDVFPEVSAGIYSPDDVGALTNEEGEVVYDVVDVGPYSGMMDRPGQRAEDGLSNAWADRDTVKALMERAKALPDGALAHLSTGWDALELPREENGKAGFRLLTNRLLPATEALIMKMETRAKAGEWGPWEPPAVLSGGDEGSGYGEVAGSQPPAGLASGEATDLGSPPPPGANQPEPPPVDDETCSHPLPWEQRGKQVYCTHPGCGIRLYEGIPARNEAQRAEALGRMAEYAAQLAARAARPDANLCMHPDPEAKGVDPVSGRLFWQCCGGPIH